MFVVSYCSENRPTKQKALCFQKYNLRDGFFKYLCWKLLHEVIITEVNYDVVRGGTARLRVLVGRFGGWELWFVGQSGVVQGGGRRRVLADGAEGLTWVGGGLRLQHVLQRLLVERLESSADHLFLQCYLMTSKDR